jgi:hypothetical protein
MSRRALVLVAALAVAAVAAPAGWAFFFRAVDQPVPVRSAAPQQYVLLHGPATEPLEDPAALGPLYALQRTDDEEADPGPVATGGAAQPLALDLGTSAGWTAEQREVDGAFALEATDSLPEGGPVQVTLTASGPFTATLRSLSGDPILHLHEPDAGSPLIHRARVDVEAAQGLAPGEHTGVLTVALRFADGSTMRYEVPVRWVREP